MSMPLRASLSETHEGDKFVFYTFSVLDLQFFAFLSKLVLLQMLLPLSQSRLDLWAFSLWISLFAFTSQIFKCFL